MTEQDPIQGARHVRLADLPRAEIGDHLWHPVRRALGRDGFRRRRVQRRARR